MHFSQTGGQATVPHLDDGWRNPKSSYETSRESAIRKWNRAWKLEFIDRVVRQGGNLYQERVHLDSGFRRKDEGDLLTVAFSDACSRPPMKLQAPLAPPQ